MLVYRFVFSFMVWMWLVKGCNELGLLLLMVVLGKRFVCISIWLLLLWCWSY